MEQNRETIKITTPIDKHEVELKAWLTGREKRDIRKVYLSEIKFGGGTEGVKIQEGISGDLIEKIENVAIETIVVSVDGSKENILERILDMKEKDYNFVIEEINKISREAGF